MMQSAHPSFSNPNSILLLKKRLNASLKEKKESFLDGCILEMKKEEWGEESQLLEGCARLMSFKPHDTPQQEDGVTRKANGGTARCKKGPEITQLVIRKLEQTSCGFNSLQHIFSKRQKFVLFSTHTHTHS